MLCVALCALGAVLQGQNIAWTRRFDRSILKFPHDAVSGIDAAGNVFVAGTTDGTFPGVTYSPPNTIFVRKYDAAGKEVWTRQFWTAGSDEVAGVAVNGSSVYVAGSTRGTFPGQPHAGSWDAYVRKFDANGNTVWTRQFGTSSFDIVRGVAADASGVYLAGATGGTLPGQTQVGTNEDGFLRKYDVNGNTVWTRQFGTSSATEAMAVSVYGSGVYVAGMNYGTFSGQTGAGSLDAFVRKYDMTGTVVWTRQFGTSTQEWTRGVSVDASGVYVVGWTIGTFTGQTSAGGSDAFVRKYSLSGTKLWTRQFGTPASDWITSVSADGSGVYVGGATTGSLPGQTHSVALGWDAFLRKYEANGKEVWTRQFGNAGNSAVSGVSVDTSGVYVGGTTRGTFPGQIGSPLFATDGFVRKYSLNGTEAWTRQIATVVVDDRGSKSAQAVDAAGNVYVAGKTGAPLPAHPAGGDWNAFVRKYDASGAVVWSRQFGTPRDDEVFGVSVEGAAVYVAGWTSGTFTGQTKSGNLSDSDAFVRKYDANGTELWTRQFGTSGRDVAYGVAADASGVYVAGQTVGAFPGQTKSGQGWYGDVFVRKYDTGGTEVWTRQFGTSGNETAYGVAVDRSGVYVVGETAGALPGKTRSGTGWDRDAFVRKYKLDGTEMWTGQFGTSGNDGARGVAVDGGCVYVAGWTVGTLAGETTAGAVDAFVREYKVDGTVVWTRQFGTSGAEFGYAVSCDASGVYVAGSTSGTFPGETNTGHEDAFVRKLGATGTAVWTRQFGTPQNDLASGVAVDGSDVYVVGASDAVAFHEFGASSTVFVVKIVQNVPPTASIAVTQLTAVGTKAAISLDGTGSSDPDDALADLRFRWTVDSVVVCEGTAAQCATYVIELPIDIALGSHQVSLRVTDPDGAFDETSTTVTVSPAQLSVLKVEEAEVEFDPGEREVEVSGEIGLPFGTTFGELLPRIRTTLAVAGKAVVAAADVSFTVKGGDKKEWKFENKAVTTGIAKFEIDWKGSRYRFHAKGFPVQLKSKLITTTETTLEVKLDPKKIPAAFTLGVGTVGTVTFDRDGAVTSSTVPYQARGKKVTLTLAGPLQATTAIRFTGGLSRVVDVGSDLKASVGRFHLHAKFGAAMFGQGVHTTPRSLDFRLQVGRQGYSGSAVLGPTQLAVEHDEWEFEEDDG